MHELAEIPCGQAARRSQGQKDSRARRMQQESWGCRLPASRLGLQTKNLSYLRLFAKTRMEMKAADGVLGSRLTSSMGRAGAVLGQWALGGCSVPPSQDCRGDGNGACGVACCEHCSQGGRACNPEGEALLTCLLRVSRRVPRLRGDNSGFSLTWILLLPGWSVDQ